MVRPAGGKKNSPFVPMGGRTEFEKEEKTRRQKCLVTFVSRLASEEGKSHPLLAEKGGRSVRSGERGTGHRQQSGNRSDKGLSPKRSRHVRGGAA